MSGTESMKLMLKPGYTDPEFEEILRKADGKVFRLQEDTDIFTLRKELAEAKKNLTAARSSANALTIDEKDVSFPTRDEKEIKIRIHSPPADLKANPTPVLVILHGGGWCLGDLDNETLLARKWCAEIGGVCVNVDYRLAPEYKFPTAVYDCYDAMLWTAANAASIGVDLHAGFVVGGISAGANISATISHLWRDDKRRPPITGVYLAVPATVSPEAVPDNVKGDYRSRQENANAPILTKGAMNLFHKLYEDDPFSPLHSPYLFPTGFKGLPRTYFQICGMDPLRDEGLIYERALREEGGVKTKVDLYPGLPHSFWSFFPEAGFSKKQAKDSMAALRWLLGKDWRASM